MYGFANVILSYIMLLYTSCKPHIKVSEIHQHLVDKKANDMLRN